jgi:molecular chaperone GrpE
MIEETANGAANSPTESTPGADRLTLDDAAAQLAALADERDRLIADRNDLNDRLLRRTAEFDNYRRRMEREQSERAERAGADTVKALLPILDDFERAVRIECTDKDYQKGIELIHQRLQTAFEKLGLEPVPALGQIFDPNLHQAIEMAETGEAEDQQILAEFARGYAFKGKLLRPAMVKVAVRKG